MVSLWSIEPALAAWARERLTALLIPWFPRSSHLPKSGGQVEEQALLLNKPLPQPVVLF